MNEKFQEFKARWLEQHPGSIPEKHKPKLHGTWARIQAFMVFFSSSIVSGVHTIPAIHATIPITVPVTDEIKWIAAAFGYGAVELAIFQFARHRMDSRSAKTALGLSLAAAITSNVYSGWTSQTDDLGRVIAVILGVVMPLIALMSGEQWAKLEREDIIETDKAKELDKEDDLELDRVINSAFNRYENKKQKKEKEAEQLPLTIASGKQSKVQALAEKIIDDGNYSMTIPQLQTLYNSSRGTVQRAKERMKQLGY